MDEPLTVPAIPTAEAESFWRDGTPAYQAETENNQAAADCGSLTKAPSTAPGRPHVAGEMPEPLCDVLAKERRVRKLIIAAKRLALAMIAHTKYDGGGERPIWIFTCRDCQRSSILPSPLEHREHCRVRVVLKAIDRLAAADEAEASLQFNSEEKENAPEAAEGVPAGDGIRTRGPLGEPWQKRIDEFGAICIYDVDGKFLFLADRGDAADRVIDCVNSAAVTGASQ